MTLICTAQHTQIWCGNFASRHQVNGSLETRDTGFYHETRIVFVVYYKQEESHHYEYEAVPFHSRPPVVRELLALRLPVAMSSARLRLIVLALSLTLLPHLAWAAIVNRTIDDSSGDSLTGLKPEFLPKNVSGLWKDQTCSDCRINPDVRLAFGNSYTAATYSPQLGRMSIVIPFNGESFSKGK